jgi:F420-0:gamma-glutamyl ligase
MKIECIPIKTRTLYPPQDNIYSVIDESLLTLQENDVLIVTSKIVAIHQGRCIPINEVPNKDDLIKQEAEYFIPRSEVPFAAATLTIKENTLIPSAGIDESNANGYYILWPTKSSTFAKELCLYLKKKYTLKNLAVIITDSHTVPLRWGVLGCAIGFYGLEPLYDYRGKTDIFGRELKMTQQNIVDALAVISVVAMGEGNEQTPIAIVRGAQFVQFTNQETYPQFIIPKEEDIYKPLLDRFHYKK